MKRRGIFPIDLILPSTIVLFPALIYFFALKGISSGLSILHYILVPFGAAAFVVLRGTAEQSGWMTTQRAAPRTVRERVRAAYLYAILFCVGSWAVCFAATLAVWRLRTGDNLLRAGINAGVEVPLFFPLCILLFALVQISVIALHLGRNTWTRSRGGQALLGVFCLLPMALMIILVLTSLLSPEYDVLWRRSFLNEVRTPLLALFAAGALLIAASWCVSLLSEYQQLALRRPRWIRIAAILCAVLCLAAGIAGGCGTVRIARARVAQEKQLQQAEENRRSESYLYTPRDATAMEIKDCTLLFAEESLLGKTRKEYDQRIAVLNLTQEDDYAEETYDGDLRSINHSYRLPETGATVYLSAELDTGIGTITNFQAHFEQDLVLDALTYAGYQKIVTDTKPGDREVSFLRQQATNGMYPEMVVQRINKFDGVEEHVYDYNVKITSFLGVLNMDDIAYDAAWLRLTVTVRDGFVTEVLPMLTTSQSWENNYAKETAADRRAALSDFRRLAEKLEQPLVGGSPDVCKHLLTEFGFTTVNDVKWRMDTDDRTVQITAADGGKAVRTFQYGAPNAVKVAAHMDAAQAEALQHCVPAGSDAETLHRALLKNELLPRTILEFSDQSGAVQREYICDLLLTQDYDTTTQRTITFTYILRDGKLAETRMEFIPSLDIV